MICKDNLGVVQNAIMKEILLENKHVPISYNMTKEVTTAAIVHPVKQLGNKLFADVITKAHNQADFACLV